MIEQEVPVGDDRQKVAIQVEKQDAENGATVAGAVFGIFNKAEDVYKRQGIEEQLNKEGETADSVTKTATEGIKEFYTISTKSLSLIHI